MHNSKILYRCLIKTMSDKQNNDGKINIFSMEFYNGKVYQRWYINIKSVSLWFYPNVVYTVYQYNYYYIPTSRHYKLWPYSVLFIYFLFYLRDNTQWRPAGFLFSRRLIYSYTNDIIQFKDVVPAGDRPAHRMSTKRCRP